MKFPRLSPDEAKLLGQCLDMAQRNYARLMPHDHAEISTRIVKLHLKLTPWLIRKGQGLEVTGNGPKTGSPQIHT